MKYTISGHETFACRHFWLKKGYDFDKNELSFSDDSAVVSLGVGKNMVVSIRFWLKVFGFFSDNEKELLEKIFDDEGFDPFLEDTNTIWILHYLINKLGEASIYSLFFNDFFARTEFSMENFKYYLEKKFNKDELVFSSNTLDNDLKVFESMYLKPRKDTRSLEDAYSGLFQELDVFNQIAEDKILINSGASKKVSPYILLYILMDKYETQSSISFNELLNDNNSIGKIFCFNQSTLFSAIESLVKEFDFMIFTEDAGIRELQIRNNPFSSKLSLLIKYYHAN